MTGIKGFPDSARPHAPCPGLLSGFPVWHCPGQPGFLLRTSAGLRKLRGKPTRRSGLGPTSQDTPESRTHLRPLVTFCPRWVHRPKPKSFTVSPQSPSPRPCLVPSPPLPSLQPRWPLTSNTLSFFPRRSLCTCWSLCPDVRLARLSGAISS